MKIGREGRALEIVAVPIDMGFFPEILIREVRMKKRGVRQILYWGLFWVFCLIF